MAMTATIGGSIMQKKRISVSQKRQITIPIEFFNTIGIENEVECYIQNNAIVIKPVRENGGAFDEEILADLIAKGYSGDELLMQFKNARKQIRPAVEKMLDESRKASQNPDKYDSYEDVFGAEE
jgi:bifunctional DNA-binding transcriptional regulator/antitoxin component of YhaV-PrlF toxin-antitoxin module